jgi:ribosomal subunit interface protein
MHIQINTDHNIDGSEQFAEHVRTVVTDALDRYAEHISRVEVHLKEQDAAKGGKPDKRCMIEVRMKGRQPTVVAHEAENMHQAIQGSCDRIKRVIGGIVDRRHDHHH